MNRTLAGLLALTAAGFSTILGCGLSHPRETPLAEHTDVQHYQTAATRIEYTDPYIDEPVEALTVPPPRTLANDDPEFRDITLQEAIRHALQNSQVVRDLGGLVLRTPQSVRTVDDPAIQELDPRFGVPAALSAFDAQVAARATVEKNDRALNNQFFGGGTRFLKQDLAVIQGEISKLSATGTQFSFRNITDYDANNAPGNTFGSAWTVQYEAEIRHPLLQGAGIEFNRIAGPGAVPGLYNGVLIARINTDISLAEFELSVRNLINDVENAYLELYFAYRDLDARIAARDAALETWRAVNALYEAGRRGGEADKETQAREQYFRFQEQVQNSLNGRLLEPTRGNNGSSGGTFRGNGGVLVAERRLRYLIGMPVTDNCLLRTADEPAMAQVCFEWDEALTEAMSRRVELRRQRWSVKGRELELQASRNFLLPSLDLIALYRWRGFGRDLLQQHRDSAAAVGVFNSTENLAEGNDRVAESRFDNRRFNNAYDNLFDGDFQEYELGVELDIPIGFRRAHSGVRNAELRLARERKLLQEQERLVALDLSNAVADVARAYAVVETNYNRRLAADENVEALEVAYEADQVNLNVLLEGQRQLADAETAYYRSVVEYALAVKNVHFEKGSLLDYNGIYLQEGSWPHEAYEDAQERWKLRTEPWRFNWLLRPGTVVSDGPAPQLVEPVGTHTPGRAELVIPADMGQPEAGAEAAPLPSEAPNQEVTPESTEPSPNENGNGTATSAETVTPLPAAPEPIDVPTNLESIREFPATTEPQSTELPTVEASLSASAPVAEPTEPAPAFDADDFALPTPVPADSSAATLFDEPPSEN